MRHSIIIAELRIIGPEAAPYLQTLTSYDLRGLTFGKSAFVPIEGFNLHVARGGYTGEDGFEVGSLIRPLYLHTIISHSPRRSPFHLHKLLK